MNTQAPYRSTSTVNTGLFDDNFSITPLYRLRRQWITTSQCTDCCLCSITNRSEHDLGGLLRWCCISYQLGVRKWHGSILDHILYGDDTYGGGFYGLCWPDTRYSFHD